MTATPGIAGLDLIPTSVVTQADAEIGLRRRGREREVVIAARGNTAWLADFEGDRFAAGDRVRLVGPASTRNAAALRSRLPWLVPAPLGLATSAGLGDRLGVATPGHIRALREAGRAIRPVFAQQSIREMSRTGRSPQAVLDDATWGVFAEGWRDGFGADADHLKTTADVDACAAAGFTCFTVDPGEHVDAAADGADAQALDAAVDRLPWEALEDSRAGLFRRYAGGTVDVERFPILLDAAAVARAAVKYARAIAHVVVMYRHLCHVKAPGQFELEISVDETESPTSHAEHYYIASELKRLGVRWVALAPRFVGRFEKGVDYIGDVEAFGRDVQVHAAIARQLGPYKLSLHSGSDKFSIYPVAVRHTRGLVHLKTAGTSYLEALRTVAAIDPEMFRGIYAFALDRYEHDRASYHVSASIDRVRPAGQVALADLPALLDDFDAREILHVTFGSVLTERSAAGDLEFHDRLLAVLQDHEEAYARNLQKHFVRHLRPFAAVASTMVTP